MKQSLWALALIALLTAQPSQAQTIGLDLAALNLCLYGDCEAGGAYAAHKWGWPNPATLPVGTTPHIDRGVFFSGGHFFVNVGDMNADVESGTMTVVWAPFVFQVNGVKGTGGGYVRQGPIKDLRIKVKLPVIRTALGVDMGAFGVPGLSLGVLGALPIVESDVEATITSLNLRVAKVKERRDVDVTVGAHYRTGHMDWFSVGAYVNGASFGDEATVFELNTFQFVDTKTTTNAWFTRVGVSILPLYGLDQLTGDIPKEHAVKHSPAFQMLSEITLSADWEHRNITAPGEGTRDQDIGYFRLDTLLLPDAWNILHPTIRPYGIVGVDTLGGYGLGVGLYGNPDGWLSWLSVDLGYSSRPLAPSFGNNVDVYAVTGSVVIPF